LSDSQKKQSSQKKQKILLVEDNRELLESNTLMLELNGYEVLTAADLTRAKTLIATSPPDAIVMDIKLPDGSGLDLCREIRGLLVVPILFLSGLGEKSDIVAGLRAGGDDYLAKPFDYEVLEARVEALLRRSVITKKNISAPEELSAGNLKLDLTSRRAYISGVDVFLTPKEFSVVALLLKNRNRFVSSEEIYRAVWNSELSNDIRAVKDHVYSIRRKFEDSDVRIEQRRGNGYRIRSD
jgi:DNA-binding response OmpR family regulator